MIPTIACLEYLLQTRFTIELELEAEAFCTFGRASLRQAAAGIDFFILDQGCPI